MTVGVNHPSSKSQDFPGDALSRQNMGMLYKPRTTFLDTFDHWASMSPEQLHCFRCAAAAPEGVANLLLCETACPNTPLYIWKVAYIGSIPLAVIVDDDG